MWSVICFLAILAIVGMLAFVALWLVWTIIRFILNLFCAIVFGEEEMF